MIQYILDPTWLHYYIPSVNDSLSSRDLKNILVDIIETTDTPFIKAGEYTAEFDGQTISFILTHDLLIRPSKNNDDELRIEVLVPTKFGSGGFGKVYKSAGVLLPDENYLFKKKPLEKARICKKIALYSAETGDNQEIEIDKEALYTQLNPILHCKSPVFDKNAGYLVMRHAQRCDLLKFINDLHDKIIVITPQQRLDITYWIINAYAEQVNALGLIHNDIKPENIIIDYKKYDVTIIDYAFAHPLIYDELKSGIYGTAEYIAPELLDYSSRSVKSDLYALGLVIAMLWGHIPTIDFDYTMSLSELKKQLETQTWNKLFNGIALSDNIKDKIINYLNSMTHLKPSKRLDLTAALDNWLLLLSEYEKEQLTSTPTNSSSDTQAVPLKRKDTPIVSRSNFFKLVQQESPINTLLMCNTM